MSSRAVIGGVNVTVDPCIGVASCLYVCTISTFADCEVERNNAVAASGVGEDMRGGAASGGVGVTIDPCIGIAVALNINARSGVADDEAECDGAVATGGVGKGVCRRGRSVVVSVVPFEAVAGGSDSVTYGTIVDGEVKCICTVIVLSRSGI